MLPRYSIRTSGQGPGFSPKIFSLGMPMQPVADNVASITATSFGMDDSWQPGLRWPLAASGITTIRAHESLSLWMRPQKALNPTALQPQPARASESPLQPEDPDRSGRGNPSLCDPRKLLRCGRIRFGGCSGSGGIGAGTGALYPTGDVALAATGDGDRSWFYVFGDH